MATATHLHDLPDQTQAAQIAADRKAEAKKHFDAIRKAGALEATSSMRIGWHAAYLKEHNLFGILGFKNEHECRIAAGVGESTWYAMIRLAEAYKGLDEEQFVSMKQVNAKALADLPESKRLSREWIRDAGSMSQEDFQEKVDEAMEGKARASDGKERGKVIKISVPASRKEVIETGLKEFAESVGIPANDTGRAMELLVVEATGQKSLIEAIANATQMIREAKKLQKKNLSAEELVEKLYAMLDQMALEFKAAMDAAKNTSKPVVN